MATRLLTASDRPLLRQATLANMNWCGPRFTFDDLDQSKELAHYYSDFPRGDDFGMLDEAAGDIRAVAWLVFFPAEHPGYGFVEDTIPELSITTFDGFRGQGIGERLLREVIAVAVERGISGISLSVEDLNRARSTHGSAFRLSVAPETPTPCCCGSRLGCAENSSEESQPIACPVR